MRSPSRPLVAVAFLLLSAAPAFATTFVMVRDQDLASQAAVIARVRVAEVESAPAQGAPATDYLVEVERVIQGHATGGSLIVRVPGGRRPQGLGQKIWGAPEFAVGERALLFLAPNRDGSFRILHLMLGAFHEVEAQGRRIALRDLAEAHEISLPGTAAEAEQARGPRDLDRFVAWLADRAAGRERRPDYFVTLPQGELESAQAPFTVFSRNGLRMRWFEFDAGGGVSWRAHSGGQPGVPGGGFDEIRRALAAWTADPDTPINYRFEGQTAERGGLDTFDGVNAILFDEPLDDEFSCATGGVLAIGGPWFDPESTGTFDGQTYIRIVSADIVTNTGLSCFFAGSTSTGKAAEELFGHELGHTLGLGHSCGDGGIGSCTDPALDDALMRAFIHDDGRGARLGSDDRAGIRSLYARSPGGSVRRAPEAPAGLTAERQDLTAFLSWVDRSASESGFHVERAVAGGAFVQIATVEADSTGYVDEGLAPGTRYDYRVRAFNAKGKSAPSNRASVETPAALPVGAALLSLPDVATTGEVVRFQAAFTGPAERAEWRFGREGVALSDAPCTPGSFCASHLFTEPGVYEVKLTVVGDVGQTFEASQTIEVAGPAVELPARRSFLQSVILGPRGDTGTFKSSVWLHNAGSSATLVELTFLPRGAGDPSPERRTLTIEPRTSVLLPNVLALFGLTGQGSIALAYRQPLAAGAAPPEVFAVSRSYVELPDPADGSFGQLVGEEPEAGWSAGQKVVAGILEGDGFIGTLLAVNLDDVAGQVRMVLEDAAGQTVGSPAVLALGPRTMRFQPVARLFPESVGRPGPFTARFTSDGVRFTGSATLLEVASEDQVFIPATPPPPDEAALGAAVSQGVLYLPRVVRNRGQFDTFLASKLVALNTADQPRTLAFELWLRGQDNSRPSTAERTLSPGQALFVDDVMSDLFGLEEATGALRILWSGPAGPGPRVLSLAFSETDGRAGQRFGMLVDSRAIEHAVTTSGTLFGAEQSDLFRSSYGAVNLGDAPASLLLTLRNGQGRVLGVQQVGLKPRQHFERSLAGIFQGLGEGGNWSIETEVLAGGPALTYLANINASGDVFFVPGRPAALP